METLKIKQIDSTEFFDLTKYPKVQTTDGCEYLGLTVDKTKTDKIRKKDYRKFLAACKKIINSCIFEGVLSIYEMDLLSFDKKRGVYVNKDGSRAILSSIDRDDNVISKKSDIKHRAIMIFVFKSKLNKVELEEKFGNLFIMEGELPKKKNIKQIKNK